VGESRAPFFITICAASGSGGMEANMGDKSPKNKEKMKKKAEKKVIAPVS